MDYLLSIARLLIARFHRSRLKAFRFYGYYCERSCAESERLSMFFRMFRSKWKDLSHEEPVLSYKEFKAQQPWIQAAKYKASLAGKGPEKTWWLGGSYRPRLSNKPSFLDWKRENSQLIHKTRAVELLQGVPESRLSTDKQIYKRLTKGQI